MSFPCPNCGSASTHVKDSRPTPKGVRRRRVCPKCDARFSTSEQVIGERGLTVLLSRFARTIPLLQNDLQKLHGLILTTVGEAEVEKKVAEEVGSLDSGGKGG